MDRVGYLVLPAALILGLPAPSRAEPAASGVSIRYQLPAEGAPPKTYRVTLAVTDPRNPDWILTAENQGRFTETWDGLDDNSMPLPPGEYGVKGITMPAEEWPVDGEYHSVVPRFAGGPSSWLPTPEQWDRPEPFGGADAAFLRPGPSAGRRRRNRGHTTRPCVPG